MESNLLNEILFGPVERKRKLTFRELAREYLDHDEHAWAESTRTRNGQLLRGYLEKVFQNILLYSSLKNDLYK